jgi:hypothetical protein
MLERGWRPTISPHDAGHLRVLRDRKFPGPWTITQHVPDSDDALVAGWVILVAPGSRAALRGMTSRRTGVHATLDQCLDEAERHIAREEGRVGW